MVEKICMCNGRMQTFQPRKVKVPTVDDSVCNDLNDIEDIPPVYKYKKGKIGVTDFSAQVWCELQLSLTLSTGRRRRETEAMKKGTARHEVLESADHEVVHVEVETDEEYMALQMLSSIALLRHMYDTGRAREIWVCGVLPHGVGVRGIIDELSIKDDRVIICDTKTRGSKTEPSNPQKRSTAIQLQIVYAGTTIC
eukprot:GHVO01023867.1.p1 GENE.GHVO01023867.1~~GHVO01023867.1.p1  ORF type:complete len:196 (+),score=25.30 GHVO01023867.1:137-724(+)